MASVITATTTSGLTQQADNSGVLQLASGTGNLVTVPSTTGTMALTASPTFTGTATIPTATVTTLNAPSGVLATQNGMTGIAKAWVTFTASTGATLATFNVSSITRNGTGDYTANFTTALSSANYVIAGSSVGATSNFINILAGGSSSSNTTTSCRFGSYATSGSAQDSGSVFSVVFFGA